MQNDLYKKFLSAGFAEINVKAYQHMIELYKYNYKKFLPQNKEAKILDIGCGMGQFLEFLGQLGYENILGVDISPEAINFCREKGINKVRLIDDLIDFLSSSEMYDLIVLNDVIEHFPKDEVLLILNKINEKLFKEGKVIIKTGNLASLVGPRIRYNDFTHNSGFTEYSLSQVLKVANFKDTVIYPFVFPKNRIRRVFRRFVQKIIHANWKLVYFFEFTNTPEIVDELIFAVARK